MKGRVMNISTVSHQLMKDGKKCDYWTATIMVRVNTRKAILRCFYIVNGPTEKAVNEQLEKYDLWQDYNFNPKELIRARI